MPAATKMARMMRASNRMLELYPIGAVGHRRCRRRPSCRQKEGRTGSRRLPRMLRSMDSTGRVLQIQIDAFAQFLARLEMGNVLARQGHRFAGLGVAPHPRRPVVQCKAAETAHLD